MQSDGKGEFDGAGHEVLLELEGASLEGMLLLPADARGLALFAHGSGSSHRSPRNQFVAGVLGEHRVGTLLFDLLTREEESLDQSSGEFRFDIPFLASRLMSATHWAMNRAETARLKMGYFGASTGAAAALVAAAALGNSICAVVSRGGRPDLAAGALPTVRAATLLIVGGNDAPVIEMNPQALEKLGAAEKRLVIVPGASHLFEEPGTLEQIARLAAHWFVAQLIRRDFAKPRGQPSPQTGKTKLSVIW